MKNSCSSFFVMFLFGFYFKFLLDFYFVEDLFTGTGAMA